MEKIETSQGEMPVITSSSDRKNTGVPKTATLKKGFTNEFHEYISATEQLAHPGDYYYAPPTKKIDHFYPIINCPFCNEPISLADKTLQCNQDEPLTMKEEIHCPYQKNHHFKIDRGNIIVLGPLAEIYG